MFFIPGSTLVQTWKLYRCPTVPAESAYWNWYETEQQLVISMLLPGTKFISKWHHNQTELSYHSSTVILDEPWCKFKNQVQCSLAGRTYNASIGTRQKRFKTFEFLKLFKSFSLLYFRSRWEWLPAPASATAKLSCAAKSCHKASRLHGSETPDPWLGNRAWPLSPEAGLN